MKKTIMLATVLLMAFGIQAKDKKTPLTVTEGSLAFMKEADATACLKIDYSNAQVVDFDNKGQVEEAYGTIDEYNAMMGEDYVRDWPQVAQKSGDYAILFNNTVYNKKGIKLLAPQYLTDSMRLADDDIRKKAEKRGWILQDEAESKYVITLHVDTIDMGNSGASIAGTVLGGFVGGAVAKSGAPVLVGMMDVTNQQTGEQVCHIDINHLGGSAQFSQTARIQMVIATIFGVLPKMAKKAK